jgi:glycosyltransferase A (GT-A) superfamily protein (DUF2064 family)
MAADLVRRLRDPRWRLVVRMYPDRARWPGAASEPQGPGDLGVKLDRALRAHARAPVAVIGTDAPEVTRQHVWRALQAARRAGVVFGPAEDGGFWLLALSARRARRVRLSGVRWSSPHALEDTRAALGGGAVLLETLQDVDDGRALRAWRRRAVEARVDYGRA